MSQLGSQAQTIDQITSSLIAGNVPMAINVTTGATVTHINAQPSFVYVTTGGTEDNETLDISLPALDGNDADLPLLGAIVFIILATLTNEFDDVLITVGGASTIDFYTPINSTGNQSISNPKLSNVGDYICFIWSGFEWKYYDPVGSVADFTTTTAQVQINGFVQGVQVATAAGTDGAQGGDITLAPGSAVGGGRNGQVILVGLPVADPHVNGALWNSAGTLKVSAG